MRRQHILGLILAVAFMYALYDSSSQLFSQDPREMTADQVRQWVTSGLKYDVGALHFVNMNGTTVTAMSETAFVDFLVSGLSSRGEALHSAWHALDTDYKRRMTAAQVQEWFQSYDDGSWAKQGRDFGEVDGEKISKLTSEQFMHQSTKHGDAIFNDWRDYNPVTSTMNAAAVHKWFFDGEWADVAPLFAGLDGNQLSQLSKEAVLRRVVGSVVTDGSLLYNRWHDMVRSRGLGGVLRKLVMHDIVWGALVFIPLLRLAGACVFIWRLRSFRIPVNPQVGYVARLPSLDLTSKDEFVYFTDDIILALRRWEQAKTEAIGTRGLLITGAPGIGKSMFARLIFCIEMGRGETVLLQTREPVVNPVLYIGAISCAQSGWVYFVVSSFISPDDIIVIWDHRSGFYDFSGDKPVKCALVVHSPSAHINNSRKSPQLGIYLVMNPLTLTEAENIRVALPHLFPPNETAASLKAKYDVCGGSLRMLCKKRAPLMQLFEEAYQISKSVPIIEFLTGSAGASGGARVPHRVMQWRRRPDDEGVMYTVFCSDGVKDRILNNAARTQHMQLMQDANQLDIEGSYRCRVLENRMFHLFATATAFHFRRRRIRPHHQAGVNFNDQNALFRVAGMQVEQFHALTDVANFQVGVMYWPRSKIFASVDCFYFRMSNGTVQLVMLQFTVSTSHSAKFPGFDDIISHAQLLTGWPLTSANCFLSFVVCEEAFNNGYGYRDGHNMDRPDNLRPPNTRRRVGWQTITNGPADLNQKMLKQEVWLPHATEDANGMLENVWPACHVQGCHFNGYHRNLKQSSTF